MRSLIINGKYYSENELIHYCQEKIVNSSKEWEKDYCGFILEWLNDSGWVHAHTSGSTGTPKALKLSKQKMRNSAQLTGVFFHFKKNQNALLCLSTNYIAGKMMVVRAFEWQLNLITVAPDGHPLRDVDLEIDFAAMIPLQVKNSLNQISKLNQIKQLLIGGGAVDTKLENDLQNISVRCFLGYGMTETVSHIAIRAINGEQRSESYYAMGKALFSVDQRKCLCIHASAILDTDLATNDVVDLISDREFRWLGRFDHVINSGGIKLFPEQIEKKMEFIMEAPFFLCGMPDEHLGEKLVLFVETELDSENFKTALLQKIKGLLPKYEQAREIYCIKRFCRTPNGKTQREATLSTFRFCK